MRLWHKQLIPYLPRQQLMEQWRECCVIARNIANKGSPNHLLVNKIMEYPSVHFLIYSLTVMNEIEKRGYKVSEKSKVNFQKNYDKFNDGKGGNYIFYDWHNKRYLNQCLYNLQEKYDCGGIPDDEWKRITDNFEVYIK